MQKGFEVVNLHGTASGVIAVPVIGENGNWWIGNEDTGVCAGGGGSSGGANGNVFKQVYLIDGIIGNNSNPVPYPDEFCTIENLIPISLAIKTADNVGYWNCMSEHVFPWVKSDGIVFNSNQGNYVGRKCKCLLGRIQVNNTI